MSDGPVATVAQHTARDGLALASTCALHEGRAPSPGHAGFPESWWLHETRQGLRLAQWRQAGNRRNDMRGIESMAGIDKLATTKAMNSTKIPREQRNDLRELFLWLCLDTKEAV